MCVCDSESLDKLSSCDCDFLSDIRDSSLPHVMSSACEDSCPWTNYLSEAINKCVDNLLSLLSSTLELGNFQLTFNCSDIVVLDDETSSRLREFFHELIALLAFDDFQLQLLKVFLLTFLSSVAFIFVAWHIYGTRITEQFMKAGAAEDCNTSN